MSVADLPLPPPPGWLGQLWLRGQRVALVRMQARAFRRARTARPRHLLVGERGELEALFYLRALGYQVVEQRWRAPEWNGDLDLVAWEGDTLVVVEVKTRSRRTLTPAEASVDRHKRKMLLGTARAYRRTLPQPPEGRIPMRFDIVSVYLAGAPDDPAPPQCELLRDVLVVDAAEAYFDE